MTVSWPSQKEEEEKNKPGSSKGLRAIKQFHSLKLPWHSFVKPTASDGELQLNMT